jgi:hypothetical protein
VAGSVTCEGRNPIEVAKPVTRRPGEVGVRRSGRPDTIDIWHAATLMLNRYGNKVLEEGAIRADEFAADGDHNGTTTWRRITAATEQLGLSALLEMTKCIVGVPVAPSQFAGELDQEFCVAE